MPFVCGFKGNEWAWQNRRWDNVQQFKDVQRIWTYWGVGLFFGLVPLLTLMVLTTLGTKVQTDINTANTAITSNYVQPSAEFSAPQ